MDARSCVQLKHGLILWCFNAYTLVHAAGWGSSSWNKHYSTWDKIQCGVPQGSILGPLLFLIYVNDLPLINKDSNDHNMILYADDTSVVIIAPNYLDLNIQANLLFRNINVWFQNDLLLLNLDKTLYTDFSTNHTVKQMGSIQYNNTSLTNASLIKFLGLMIDSNLTWNHQVDSVLRRLSSSCYALHQWWANFLKRGPKERKKTLGGPI